MKDNADMFANYALALVFAGLHILDVLTTMIFMGGGYPEGNFFARFYFEMLGFGTYQIVGLLFAVILFVMYDLFIAYIGGKLRIKYLLLIMNLLKIMTVYFNIGFIWRYMILGL